MTISQPDSGVWCGGSSNNRGLLVNVLGKEWLVKHATSEASFTSLTWKKWWKVLISRKCLERERGSRQPATSERDFLPPFLP